MESSGNPQTPMGIQVPQSTKKLAEDMRNYGGAAVYTTYNETNAQLINQICGKDPDEVVKRIGLIIALAGLVIGYFVYSYVNGGSGVIPGM